MRASILAPLALAALVTIGCRSGGNQELIERELRFQESELYRLHDQLDEAASKVCDLERENASLRKELGGGGRTAPARTSSGDLVEPSVELPPPPPGASGKRFPRSQHLKDKAPPLDLLPPSVVPGIEMTPGEPALVPNAGAEEIPSESPPPRQFDAKGASHKQALPDEVPAAEGPVVDRRVARIVLNKSLTGAADGDGSPEDGALTAVFEPRNAAGQFVKATGEVSIVAIDPALTGPAARVARWDYKPNELQAHYRSSDGARGYFFDLHWPGRPPLHSSLELFIRLKTADGQRYIANQPIQVTAADEAAPGNLAGPESGDFKAARVGAPADEIANQMAARDGQRPRLFSRIRGAGSSDSGKGQAAPSPPSPDGSLNINVPGMDGPGAGPTATAGGTSGSTAPKTARLIDRSKLRGGPGFFDGSRVRALTGAGHDDKAPPAGGTGSDAPPFRPGTTTGNRGGEAPPFQGSGGPQSNSGDAPRFNPGDNGGGREQGPAVPNIDVQEPIGGPPPTGDFGAQSDAPDPQPPARTARPVWRPYR